MNTAAASTNHQIRLARRPVGLPTRADWSFTAEPVAQPEAEGVLVKTLALSLDPAMRGWMNEGKSYIAPVGIDEVMRAGGIGTVIASRNAKFAVGDRVSGALGMQEYARFDNAQLAKSALVKIDLGIGTMTQWLNVLGMPGMTAYFGLLDVGQPKAGETVVVSGAAGAVGQTVGQLAKVKGCRAVGIAGGPEKCRHVVEELGFDAAIDYKAGDLAKALHQNCPDGIDVYFDNVGGEILDATLAQIRRHARVVICGAISQYNAEGGMRGPSNYMSLLVNHASMAGFVIFDYFDRLAEGGKEMGAWLAAGKLKSFEDIATGGIERFPDTLLRLFKGENLGKLVLEVSSD